MNPSQHTLQRARQDLQHLVRQCDLDAIETLCLEDAAKRHQGKNDAYGFYQDAYTLMLSMYAYEIRYQVQNK